MNVTKKREALEPAAADQSAAPALRWKGGVPRFSRFREGGPGRPASLAVLTGIGVLLIVLGQSAIEAGGISGGGPAALLFGAFVLGFVALWVFIKAVLRSRQVTFVVDAKGVAIRPSTQQRKLDKKLFWLSMLVFWATWRGGYGLPGYPLRAGRKCAASSTTMVRGRSWCAGGRGISG